MPARRLLALRLIEPVFRLEILPSELKSKGGTGFSEGPRFMPGFFVQDFVMTRISARHTISLMNVCARPKLRRQVTRCPARHEARALRSDVGAERRYLAA